MNWWWWAVGWVACGGLALLAATLRFSSPWYTRVGIFLGGPFGLGLVLYVLYEMGQSGDI